jgi:type II secretory pathway pseudopilin PulG
MFLVESLVALGILAVVVGSLLQGVTSGVQGAQQGRQQMQAGVIAEAVAEEIRMVSASGTWGTHVWVPFGSASGAVRLVADGRWYELSASTVPAAPDPTNFTVTYRAVPLGPASLATHLEIKFPPIATPPASCTATGLIASASVSRLTAPNLVDCATDTLWNPGPIKPGSYALTFWREFWRPPHGIHPGYWEIRPFSFYRYYCIYASSTNWPFCWELQCSNDPSGGWTTIDRRSDVYCVAGWNKFQITPLDSPNRRYFRLVISDYEGAGLSLGEVYFPRSTDPVPGEPHVPPPPNFVASASVHPSSANRLVDGSTGHPWNPPGHIPPVGDPYVLDFDMDPEQDIQVEKYRLFCDNTFFPTQWTLYGSFGSDTFTLDTGATTTWQANSWATFTCDLVATISSMRLVVASWSGSALKINEIEFIQPPPPPPPATFVPPDTPFRRLAAANVDDANADRLVDNVPDSFWNTGLLPPPVDSPERYVIDLTASFPFIAREYTMFCQAKNTPRAWTLDGRRPSGSWYRLDTRSNETWPGEGWRSFTFPDPPATEPASYAAYRMTITAYNGDGVSIAEFDFPHKYVLASDTRVFAPGTLLQVEVRVQPRGTTDPAEGAWLRFLVGRRGAE